MLAPARDTTGGPLAFRGKRRGEIVEPRGGSFRARIGPVLFDVGGVLVDVRGAGNTDVEALRRQIGLLSKRGEPRTPDVEIEFTDHADEPHRLLGPDRGYSDEGFVARSDRGVPVTIALSTHSPLRLAVPRGAGNIPLLPQLLSVAARRKGLVPLHASAVVWHGRGLLLAGWSKGGKTEALLSFMERGATYAGDEWLFLSPDTLEVTAIPEPIRIRDWHFDDLPRLRRTLPLGERAKLGALAVAGSSLGSLPGGPGSSLAKLGRAVNRQRHLRIDPARIFGPHRCTGRAAVDAVFLMTSWTTDDVTITPVEAKSTAHRIGTSTLFEHLRLLEAELEHDYARPDSGTPLWDSLASVPDELEKVLADLPSFEVAHPYPTATADLFQAMAPMVEGLGR